MTSASSNEQAFPWPRTCPFSPPVQYARLREKQSIAQVQLPSGEWVWVITRYEHFRKVLSDLRFSSEHSHPGFPGIFPVTRRRDEGDITPKLTYSGMDPPVHTFHRRMVASEFTIKRIANFRPRIQQIVDEHIQAMLDSTVPVDLVKILAEPVTSQVISELLGVPHAVRATFQELSRIVLSHRSSPEQLGTASTELKSLISKLLVNRESDPRDDFLGRLISKYQSSNCYDHEQMIQLVGALITAGHETTANMISLGTLVLLEHPDQLAELINDSTLFGQAIEELLRYLSIADIVTARVALADVEIDGVTIRAGDGVIALGAAANNDPKSFKSPEVLDIHRGSNYHIAFGYGIHTCLGQHLARLELEVVFATLFKRIPGLRLAIGVEELSIKESGVIHGVQEVPVTW
jgi:cytochrome P450